MGGRRFLGNSRFAMLSAGIGVAALFAPNLAAAAEATPDPAYDATPRRSDSPPTRQRLFALEANAVVTRELVPSSFLGFDAALVLGNDSFGLRAGGALMGAPSFRLAANEISNVLAYGLLDGCVSKNVRVHRVRMCLGGEVGGWKHFWTGYGKPDRVTSMHVAGTLKGDYRYRFTRNFGLLLGVGLSVPTVGPQFRGHDPIGRPTPVLVPGPVAGTLRIGGSFGIG